jgi:hypothetical protein
MEAGMFRSIVAFLVTPLVVPLLFAASSLRPDVPSSSFDVLVSLFIAVVAYAGTFLVGLPTYLFLRNKKWTAFWIAPIAGFSMLAKGMAFIRPDELKFVTMVVRFRPPSVRAKVELTPQPAEP